MIGGKLKIADLNFVLHFIFKVHCHHCGKIFCEACRSKIINASVSRRAHQVCDLCHAMLTNDPKALLNDINEGSR
jgi:hypothetical protein